MLRSLIESGLVPVVDLREIFRQASPLLPAVLPIFDQERVSGGALT